MGRGNTICAEIGSEQKAESWILDTTYPVEHVIIERNRICSSLNAANLWIKNAIMKEEVISFQ